VEGRPVSGRAEEGGCGIADCGRADIGPELRADMLPMWDALLGDRGGGDRFNSGRLWKRNSH
jgi:hypothetical protein